MGNDGFEVVIFCGIPASGKTTFYNERFATTHTHISLDKLRTRHREEILFQDCLAARHSCVIDNTNPTISERVRYVIPARLAGAKVTGYYFSSKISECIRRNALRTDTTHVPEVAIKAKAKELIRPAVSEGFDILYYVMITEKGFQVEEYSDEQTK